MKKRQSATFFLGSLFCLALAPSANAANEVWSAWERVATLEPTVRGWVWISLQGGATVTCGSGAGHTNVNPYLAYSGGGDNAPVAQNGGFDRTYSALLTAMISNREVMFRLAPGDSGSYCYVERIRVR